MVFPWLKSMSSSPIDRGRAERQAKRRRISRKQVASSSPISSASVASEKGADKPDGDNVEKENGKPVSKYKIHIPKDDVIPEDVFFTQPPQRSNSPYRIENFHWQKPEKPIPPPVLRAYDDGNVCGAVASPTLPRSAVTTAVGHDSGETPSTASHDAQEGDSAFDISDEDLLADIKTDELSSDKQNSKAVSIDHALTASSPNARGGSQRRPTVLTTNLKQMTLFGTQTSSHQPAQSQARRKWPMANRQEPPTHHKLERDAMDTWVYPINLGAIRDYQFTITATGLYHNLLVALPTGLGKTFIAATIMLNWYRWTSSAQIVFVAPTRPLVAQQVKACFEIAGIPRSKTTMLTGSCAPGLRAEEWQSKRVFFMTPQTLINDLKTGICDPKRLVLIVVDEAHRATGAYAYVEVVKFVKRFNESFRVLALTATPGASIEAVQAVIDGLCISRVEIRTEDSLDIRHFVHARKIETVLFDFSAEMEMILDLFSKALQPTVNKLTGMNAYWSKDPLSLSPYGCTLALKRWIASDAGRKAHFGVKNMVMTTFSLLASLSHATELLKFHGIGPFYHKVLTFRNELHAGGKKGGKEANAINTSKEFQILMSRVQIWINSSDFLGHPKLEYVQRIVMNHFLDAGEGRSGIDPSSTRIMIFAHYRQSAEEIVRILKRNDPMIRPHVFVGQSSVKDSEGMDQKKQLEIISKFQSGVYNTLVATSIGEEGLDIGEVDLIICYDASASPIRMLQRMGRTGRKRAGNIVVTLMRGKEENSFLKAKDNYEKMQHEIASGARFAFHDETVRRIIPRDVQPVVDRRVIEIPVENTQAELPEPAKRGRPPKRPPKKFHMPDDVHTGFRKASRLHDDEPARHCGLDGERKRQISLEPIPTLSEAVLSSDEQLTFEEDYLEISGDLSEAVSAPLLDRFPKSQCQSRPFQKIGHSRVTARMVATLSSTMLQPPSDVDPSDKKEIDHQARCRTLHERCAHSPSRRGFRASTATASSLDSPTGNMIQSNKLDEDHTLATSPLRRDSIGLAPSSSVEEGTEIEERDRDMPDLETIIRDPQYAGVPAHAGRVRAKRGQRRVIDDDSDE